MSSPGSMTMASFVFSSPTTEQLHCSGPTGKISWIMNPSYHEEAQYFTRRNLECPLELAWISAVNCAHHCASEVCSWMQWFSNAGQEKLMDRIRFVIHRGQRILLVDFTGCSDEEVAAMADRVPEVVT